MDFFLSLGLWGLVVGATLPFTSEGGRQLGVKVLLASSSVVLLLGAWLLTSRVGSSQPLLVASLAFLALMATALISAVRSDSPALLLIHSPAWAVLTLGFLWKMRELVGVLETDLNAVLTIGVALIIVVTSVFRWPRRLLKRLIAQVPAYILAVLGLVLVILPFLQGVVTNEAHISAGFFGLGYYQPAELGRILLLIALAKIIVGSRQDLMFAAGASIGRQLWIVGVVFLPVLAAFVGNILSSDLGPLLLLYLCSLVVAWCGGVRKWQVLAASLASVAGVVVFALISDRFAHRLRLLADPFVPDPDILSQIGAGLVAMTYGPTGLGLGLPSYIQEWQTDSALAAASHELGMKAMIIVVVCAALMVLASAQARACCDEAWMGLAIIALTSMVFFQTLLMAAGNLALFPLTGLAVPLFSMNGSSILATCLLVGIVSALASDTGRGAGALPPSMDRAIGRTSLGLQTVALLVLVGVGFRWVTAETTQERAAGLDRFASLVLYRQVEGVVTADGAEIATWRVREGHLPRPATTRLELADPKYRAPYVAILEAVRESDACHDEGCGRLHTTIRSSVQEAGWEAALEVQTEGLAVSVVAADLESGGLVAYLSTHPPVPQGQGENAVQFHADGVSKELVAPGSVVKPLVGAIAIGEGLSTKVDAGAQFGGVSSMSGEACGSDLDAAMRVSCNPYFAKLGHTIGRAKLDARSAELLNSQRLVDGVKVARSQLLDPEDGDDMVPVASIGLGSARVTPFALLSVTSQIARGGDGLCMHLLADSGVDCDELPKMDLQAARQVADSMRSVVLTGTAREVPGLQDLQAAAKTGTADFADHQTNATFVAFAPADKPRYAVAVVVRPIDTRSTVRIQGSTHAGPVAVAVLKAALEGDR